MGFAISDALNWAEIAEAGVDSLAMLGGALGFIVALGLPLGIVLHLVARRQWLANARLYAVLSLGVNVLRSMPFIILLILLIVQQLLCQSQIITCFIIFRIQAQRLFISFDTFGILFTLHANISDIMINFRQASFTFGRFDHLLPLSG